jgi:hypothetical protein
LQLSSGTAYARAFEPIGNSSDLRNGQIREGDTTITAPSWMQAFVLWAWFIP